MNWVFISLIITTLAQLGFCGFHFAFLFSLIGRILYILRLLGTVLPVKVSKGLEIADVFLIITGMIFSKSGVDWGYSLLSFLFCAIALILYIIDDAFYLYVVLDDEEE